MQNIISFVPITKNGKVVAKLANPHQNRVDTAKSLPGILEVKSEDLIDALTSPMKDYEDSVAEQVAERSGMECIVTRDPKDYKAGLAQIYSPKDFIRFMKQEES